MRTLLLRERFVLEKSPGKGGWTYVMLPGFNRGAGVTVMLSTVIVVIESIELQPGKLMKIKDGRLFLPVNAALRKAIGKQVGDVVTIELYIDGPGTDVISQLMECLADEPKALKNFEGLDPGVRTKLVEWISEAASEEALVERIAKTVTTLSVSGFPFSR